MAVYTGFTFRDKITGFQGVCVGYVQYLTGCNQVLLVPKSDNPNKRDDSEWFDVQRVELINEPRVVLDNGSTPGSDKQAPKD